MRSRLFLSLVLLFIPVLAAAQSNELGLFVATGTFNDTDLTDPVVPDLEASLEIDETMGYGISFNRYWTPAFSTEFAAMRLNSDVQATVGGLVGPSVTVGLGEFEMTTFTAIAQLHFARNSMISPYIGGGVALAMGDLDVETEDDFGNPVEEELEVDDEISWVANAGLDVNLGQRFALFGDVRYIRYHPDTEDDEGTAVALDLDPLVISAGVKFRF